MRTTELVSCPRNTFDRLGPAGVRGVVIRWLRLVAADAETGPPGGRRGIGNCAVVGM